MQIIGGDLNTMGHGIARFSPYHCTDRLRWATLGQEEAAFWVSHLFSIPDPPVHSSHPSVRVAFSVSCAGENQIERYIEQFTHCQTEKPSASHTKQALKHVPRMRYSS